MRWALTIFCVLLAAPSTAAAAGFAPPVHPKVHRDGVDRKARVDLRSASFAQVGTQLWLTVRTRSRGGAVCVTVGGGRMCVGTSGKARYRGKKLRAATVERSGRTLRVLVYPGELGLGFGTERWFVRSRGDRLPNSGSLRLGIDVYGAPACFGAAAIGPCENPALRRMVVPRPRDAELLPDLACRRIPRSDGYEPATPCAFGALYASGPPRLALIGDSHGASFRATAEVAAQALRVKAASLTESGCGFATETDPGWPEVSAQCRRFVKQVLRWLRAHPSVRTVIVAQSALHGYSEDGLAEMWSRIPDTVKDVYVVVDVPRVSFKTSGCVRSVRKRHAVSTGACAVPRDDDSLPRDPAPGAVAKSAPRVQLVDFTDHFCDAERCFPVIGGAYVYRDTNHMNPLFAGTLGPYLLDAMAPGR